MLKKDPDMRDLSNNVNFSADQTFLEAIASLTPPALSFLKMR